jgi:DNA-binding MarR family transcriptional regulator
MFRTKNIRVKNISGNGYSAAVSTAAQTAAEAGAAPATDCPQVPEACPLPGNTGQPDLTWLLHRAAQNMRAALDEAAQAHGLAGARDWMVLSALRDGPPQTQLALAHSLGLDKTTTTSLLDRMEARGLITRCTDRHDRRARIPVLTETGSSVQAEVTRARDRVEASLLAAFTPQEQDLLRHLLVRLAGDAPLGHGSCI